ncbi:hypothetical protein [Comamonas thiooxydans]|uniref:hypothetical protein n=1 Tax=Comamonas thiooxydans TaxID=363952 RepID=UPI00118572E1|nr:hypothetical protein [Comamonas thiooxydans]
MTARTINAITTCQQWRDCARNSEIGTALAINNGFASYQSPESLNLSAMGMVPSHKDKAYPGGAV